MTEYRVTFGQQYPREPHPALALAHHDGWVAILATDEPTARLEAHRLLGAAWAGIYAPEDGAAYPGEDLYPLGQLLRVVAPTTGAVYLLTDGEALVHVWADGTGELAHRENGRWGIPRLLTPAP